MSKSLSLSSILAVSLFSAGAAFFANPYVLRQAEGRIHVQDLPPGSMAVAGYTAAFLTSFLLLSVAARHVKLTLKPQGLEKTKGAAPKVARFLLAGLVFMGPLCVLLQAHVPHDKLSLKSLMAEAEARAQGERQSGYRQEDRAGLGARIRKEDAHD